MPGQDLQISQQELVFIFTTTVVFLALLITFFFIIIITYYRTNARRQKELLRAIVETQENERDRIAMDMHDELGPLLSAVKLQVGSLKSTVPVEMNSTLIETEDLLDDAIGEIRQIIRDLVPRNIDQKGLHGVLNDLKVHFETFAAVKVQLVFKSPEQRFSLQSEINIYRIIQEIVNNAAKHAQSEEVTISLNGNEDRLKIEVADAGKGFDTSLISAGSGLKNIETRIKLNDGEYQVKSEPGKGTHYLISFEKKKLV
ncbi:MAG: sensor histidine kinase [Chitinophagales bacterium]